VLGGASTPCITGWSCYNATISSPDVIENNSGKKAVLAIRRTNVTPVRGLVWMIGGHAGQVFWDRGTTLARTWEDRMVAAGYDLVQYRHTGRGWPWAMLGNRQGFIRTACRPATAIRWTHDNWLRGGEFMILGSSQGSAAVGWAMAMYGLDSIVDRAVYISGPPMSDLIGACLDTGDLALAHPGESGLVDEPDGYDSNGPCTLRTDTPDNRNWWLHNSVETADDTILPGGATIGNYRYSGTRVGFIIGDKDSIRIRLHAQKLIDGFAAAGQPTTVMHIPGMGHPITQSQAGLDALFNFLTAP